MGIVLLLMPFHAAGQEPRKTSSVAVDPGKVTYTLPKHVWGMKFQAYNTHYVDDTSRTTSDGKTYSQLILGLRLDWLKSALTRIPPGTPSSPHKVFQHWKTLADRIVDQGGVYFPEIHIGPATMPTGNRTPPEEVSNIHSGEWGPGNVKAWFDHFAATKGVEKLRGCEPYNEPATYTDRHMRRLWWYSQKDFTYQGASRRAGDWATVHHRQVADPLMRAYPDLVVCGGAFAAPASWYGIKEMSRFIKGYEGWPWPDNNTAHMNAFSVHSYGYRAASGLPAAPDGGQSSINSYFYPAYKRPGKVSGYKAAVDEIRKVLDEAGGSSVKIANTEWWAIGNKYLDPVNGSRAAFGDVIGVVVHCQNAARWNFDSISFHTSSPGPCKGDLSEWTGPEDFLIAIANKKLYRSQRYFTLRDICGHFLNNYKSLLDVTTVSPLGPPGAAGNPIPKIQACAGRNSRGIGILLMNTDTSAPEPVRVSWKRPARGPVTVRKLPGRLPIDTPIPAAIISKFNDPSKTSLTLELGPTEAVLLEIPRR